MEVSSLLYGLRVRTRDGVAVQECEELAESVEEGPVGQQADALVGVDRALGCVAVCRRHGGGGGGRGGGGLVWIRVREAQLEALLVSQTLLRVRLIELDGSTIHLKHRTHSGKCIKHSFKNGCAFIRRARPLSVTTAPFLKGQTG